MRQEHTVEGAVRENPVKRYRLTVSTKTGREAVQQLEKETGSRKITRGIKRKKAPLTKKKNPLEGTGGTHEPRI